LIVVLGMTGLAASPQAEALVPGYWEQTPLPHTGLATFYAAGMMEHVLDVRAAHGQMLRCDACVGTVALLRAGDIGRRVWLQPPGGEPVGPFLVIDCARREDIPMLVARGWAVDVSYELGQLWGMDRPLEGVTVLADPADLVSSPAELLLAAPTRFVVPADSVVLSTPTPTPPVSPTPWRPTPWPTRLPGPLAMRTAPASDQTAAADRGAVARFLPTPLTPVITTPTPAAMESAGQTPIASPSPTPEEMSVGRPGSQLLAPAETPSVLPTRPRSTATPTPGLRRVATAGPTSPPILLRVAPPTATPQADSDGGLLEWLRSLLGISSP